MVWTRPACLLSLLTAALLRPAIVHGEEPVHAASVRAAVAKAVPYLEERGVWWIEQKKCVTCHRVGNMIWSLTAARDAGVTLTERPEDRWDWAAADSLRAKDDGTLTGAGNREGVAQLVLVAKQLRSDDERAETLRELREVLRAGQADDGSWKPGGQLPMQRRPEAETTVVSTAWIALALAGNESSAEAVRQAADFVAAAEPGITTERAAVTLLLAEQISDDETAAAQRDALLATQNPDGGWGWVIGEESDALGTGLAVYALSRRGETPTQSEAMQRAVQFLLDTQTDRGHWPTVGTKKNRGNAVHETSTYWATAWAVQALAASISE